MSGSVGESQPSWRDGLPTGFVVWKFSIFSWCVSFFCPPVGMYGQAPGVRTKTFCIRNLAKKKAAPQVKLELGPAYCVHALGTLGSRRLGARRCTLPWVAHGVISYAR